MTAPTRAALYARFSSDLQSDRSIDDQLVLCRDKASREGWQVVAEFHDRAKSGASIFGRAGIAELMAKAKERAFDVVIVEALDRLSRDMEDTAHIFKRLTFAGIDLVAVHEGRADSIQVGLRGIVSALYLTDLAHKIRRGAAGNVRAGKHAGSMAYGYRATPGRPGEWAIEPAEAAIIVRIFSEAAEGLPNLAIVKRLNAEGITPPRGRYWRPNSLVGSRSRNHGILRNSVYCGKLVWNRVRMIKNPDTGKRVSRVNPEGEWLHNLVPRLAIVPKELFDAVQATLKRRSSCRPGLRKVPKALLSGLLRCETCGGGMSIKGRDRGGRRIICTSFHNGATCDNYRTFYLHHIERLVLSGLREHLIDPRAIEHFLKTYIAERKRLAAQSDQHRATLERRLAETKRKLGRIVDAMLDSHRPTQIFHARLLALETEQSTLEAELKRAAVPANVIALHPAAIQHYLAVVDQLATAISERAPDGAMARQIRELVESVTVKRTAPGEALRLRINGRLATLLGSPVFPEGSLSGVSLVAGEGLEPPTPGL
jgi:site-specific DNA recombinase